MKIKENGNNGSEIHRLKPMQENYDKETFDRMYKICNQLSDVLLSKLIIGGLMLHPIS